MSGACIDLNEAIGLARTGDLWLFRGRSVPDRAIQLTTNSPVNHVGMAVVLDDLPPLMWHAELGRSLPDVWSGTHHRGVQLHDLRSAVVVWARKYGQQAWLRQLEATITREMEDAVLRTIARLDGTPFPSTARLAGRWLRGRIPSAVTGALPARVPGAAQLRSGAAKLAGPVKAAAGHARGTVTPASAYCAEVVAVTYEAMGLVVADRDPGWYDPGRFWSGDDLGLAGGARLSGEIAVTILPSAVV